MKQKEEFTRKTRSKDDIGVIEKKMKDERIKKPILKVDVKRLNIDTLSNLKESTADIRLEEGRITRQKAKAVVKKPKLTVSVVEEPIEEIKDIVQTNKTYFNEADGGSIEGRPTKISFAKEVELHLPPVSMAVKDIGPAYKSISLLRGGPDERGEHDMAVSSVIMNKAAKKENIQEKKSVRKSPLEAKEDFEKDQVALQSEEVQTVQQIRAERKKGRKARVKKRRKKI